MEENAYTMREARIHVRHVRDLLNSMEALDAYNGAECASLSFLNTVTQGDITGRCNFLSSSSILFFLSSSSFAQLHGGAGCL